jgi:hypothetical protein
VSCTCTQPNAKNVLKNAGIDQDVTGWIASQGSAVYSTSDSESCPFSGSMQITIPAGMEFTVSECVSAPLSGTFNFGASVDVLISGGIGTAICAADFFSGFACDRDQVTMQETATSANVSGWQRMTGQVAVTGANSVKLECFVFADAMSQTTIGLDELFVTAAPGLY